MAGFGGANTDGDLRERLTALEVEIELTTSWAQERTTAQAKRMDGIDTRLGEGSRWMREHEQRLGHAERALLPLPELVGEVKALRESWAKWRGRAYYGAAGLLLTLVMSGKIGWGEAIRLALGAARVFGAP